MQDTDRDDGANSGLKTKVTKGAWKKIDIDVDYANAPAKRNVTGSRVSDIKSRDAPRRTLSKKADERQVNGASASGGGNSSSPDEEGENYW